MRFRPTLAEVDLDAIRHNVRMLKPGGAELMAVVKADAYGHGAAPVARAALDGGASWLGVALVEEGLALREAGIEAPVLVLTELPAGSEKHALTAGLTPSLYTTAGLEALAAAAEALGGRIGVHLKVDTGMHRVGLAPEEAEPLARAAKDRALEIEGVWTHFAKAGEPGEPTALLQLRRFRKALDGLATAGIRPRLRHAANSAAALTMPDAHLDLVRVGIAMYGLAPSPWIGRGERRPAMTLRSRVSLVKRVAAGESLSYGLTYRLERASTIATVPVGYADGYPRAASGQAQVLVGGRRHPVAGTVTMDQLMVDLGDHSCEAGDEVVLIGVQGDEEITADEVAGWAGTIGYEVVCSVGPRVPREHRGEA